MTRDLRSALAAHVLVADGGMGTMLQGYELDVYKRQVLDRAGS